ncbi:argininosuccinate lyase [Candidatus Sumerlaeota bacterium]|nr:argininosuccinate lyase [Candidatus Sumerlaeota bacterium]
MKKSSPRSKSPKGPVWGGRIAGPAGKANLAFCAGWDVRPRPAADLALLPYDLWTNRAHCIMLMRAKTMSRASLRRILSALDRIEALAESGRFTLRPHLEDVHLNVEAFVEKHEGIEVAGLMHTARSRNDQVATDMRLYLRERVLEFVREAIGLADVLVRLAKKNATTPMPGLTHHQPAAWTTFGHWAASHAAAFTRDVRALLDLYAQFNLSPLGAAASFGTSWPIDRAYAAELMGFDGVQTNSLDCITNRSEFETRVAAALAVWATHAATLAQDLVLFSSPPWHLIRIDDAFVTGSSIMPQKRNPDFAEAIKAKATLAASIAGALLGLTRGDPSGYNREQQWSKYLTMDLFDEIGSAPTVLTGALGSLALDKERMYSLMSEEYLEAADMADYLAQTRRVPFRAAYRWMGQAVRMSEKDAIPLVDAVNRILDKESSVRPLDPDEEGTLSCPGCILMRRSSAGGPSPDAVEAHCEELRESIRALRTEEKRRARAIDNARGLLRRTIARCAR